MSQKKHQRNLIEKCQRTARALIADAFSASLLERKEKSLAEESFKLFEKESLQKLSRVFEPDGRPFKLRHQDFLTTYCDLFFRLPWWVFLATLWRPVEAGVLSEVRKTSAGVQRVTRRSDQS